MDYGELSAPCDHYRDEASGTDALCLSAFVDAVWRWSVHGVQGGHKLAGSMSSWLVRNTSPYQMQLMTRAKHQASLALENGDVEEAIKKYTEAILTGIRVHESRDVSSRQKLPRRERERERDLRKTHNFTDFAACCMSYCRNTC
eukprot:2154859-Amphidinium_carterae.1